MPWTQPLNRLSPFEVLDEDGYPLIRVDENGTRVYALIFKDGTVQETAATQGASLTNLDSGTF